MPVQPLNYKIKHYRGLPIRYRPETSDERVIEEVLDRRCYRRPRLGFDVLPGESWLDLGANIGTFGVYCLANGATAECYEPEPECFKLLVKNVPGLNCIEAAVTASNEPAVRLWTSSKSGNYSRATCLPTESMKNHTGFDAPNYPAANLIGRRFDGVKMDIEGAEGDIIDRWLLPECSKLVLEYHSWRFPDTEMLSSRLEMLKSRFAVVDYRAEYDRDIARGFMSPRRMDRLIFCIGPKEKPTGVSSGLSVR